MKSLSAFVTMLTPRCSLDDAAGELPPISVEIIVTVMALISRVANWY